jgi:hypothetical protein
MMFAERDTEVESLAIRWAEELNRAKYRAVT